MPGRLYYHLWIFLTFLLVVMAPPVAHATTYDYTYTTANAVDGVIQTPMAEVPCCDKTAIVIGNGKDPVYLENEPLWWSPTIKVISLGHNTVQITDNHADGEVLTLKNVPAVYFAWGSGGFYLPSLTPTASTTPPVAGICGSANKSQVSTAPASNLCNYGTPSTISGTGPFTWMCNGSNGGTNASCSTSQTKAQSCTDTNGGVHASGSSYTLQVSQTAGSLAATTAQCPYGGTQPTTTTVTQVYQCTNGTSSLEGGPIITTSKTGNPSCNAPAMCGSTPSGSTVTETVSSTSGSTAATTAQCPYGGTQPTTTTVTQVQLCTNGTLANQGAPVSTTASAGNPTCNAPAMCGSTPSGSTVTQTVSSTSGSTSATTAQCPYGGTQPTTTTVTQVQLCTNGTLTNQGAPVSTTATNGNPTCNAPAMCGSTPSGSTVTETVSSTFGSTLATAAQCPYGGTQPTTTTVTQVELCTNGTLSNQGSPVSTTTTNGVPSCNAPAMCGSTPSGSTVTETISSTSGSIAATLAQCPYGGTQPTTTTVTQVQLCTNGTLADQGGPISTTASNGAPSCASAPANGAYTIQIGGTTQSLSGPLTLPAPTISAANEWYPQVVGTTGNDVFDVRNWSAGCSVNGNGGNDVYYEDNCAVTLASDGGVNTQLSSNGWGVSTMTPGFKNMIYVGTGSYANGWITIEGNNLDDILVANDLGIHIIAGTGNDTMVGGAGPDTFAVPETTGNTTIINFTSGTGVNADTITLDFGTFINFYAIQSAMTQQGSNVVLSLPNGKTVTFVNHKIADFLPSNFTPTSNSFALPLANGTCGSAQGATLTTTPSGGALCTTGTATAVSGNGPWSWGCTGISGGTSATCSALLSTTPVNGQCGSSSGQSFAASTPPTSNLCNAGNASTLASSGSTWTWTCSALNGGTNASCSANQLQPVNAQCGPANGSSLISAPSTGLCTTGTSSSVAGGSTGPWSWTCSGLYGGTNTSCQAQLNTSCTGTAIPTPASLILPPSVPQRSQANDIVGFNIQNVGNTTLSQPITFGQIFAAGQVSPTANFVARINGTTYPAQVDSLSTWPDGSLKLGAVTLATQNICAGGMASAMLATAGTNDPVLSPTPVSVTAAPITLTATLAFTSGSYTGTQQINLGSALKLALNSSPNYWLQGALATEARVDVPVPGGPLHVTADVTVYADGSMMADVQFNNDLTTIIPQSGAANPQAPLAPLQFSATIAFQGTSTSYTVSQDQYTDWHAVLWSKGTQNINVQHDVAYLEHAGAILPYDRTTGVANTTLQSYSSNIIQQSGFNTPLAINGVTTYMPTTGGRADIGYTTQYNTVWLLTQDARAAAVGLAQSDASGAVPWNMKLTNGHWLTPGDDAAIWSDGRGGPNGYTDGIANEFDTSVWQPDTAHQPNLNYVPYIMTGSRWNLDRLNAQAAFDLNNDWPGFRCLNTSCGTTDDIVLNGGDQIRAQAWNLREIEEAGFIGKPGSFEQSYYSQVVNDNWTYVESQEAGLTAAGGQVYGYWGFGDYGAVASIPEWQEDYLTGTVVLGAEMGYSGATQYVSWQKDAWLAGRFNVPSSLNMNPYDGCAYNITMGYNNNGTLTPYTTWAAIESATVAAGQSNGTPTGAWNSGGDYCQLARAVLGGALTLFPNDTNLQQALTWVNNSQEQFATTPSEWQGDPTFNVVPLQ